MIAILWTYSLTALYFTHKFNSSDITDEDTPIWGRVVYYQLVPLGILYNIIFMNLAFQGIDNAMLYLLLISALFSAGAVSSYQHLIWLGPLFVCSVMAPQFVYYLIVDVTSEGAYTSFLIVVFTAFMTNIGAELHKNAMQTLSLNHELKAAK